MGHLHAAAGRGKPLARRRGRLAREVRCGLRQEGRFGGLDLAEGQGRLLHAAGGHGPRRAPAAVSHRNPTDFPRAGKRQAAGWFLEQAGVKQLTHRGAVIFQKHANIIVKTGDCKAQDVFELSKKMYEAVKEEFRLDLIREVRFVGRFDGMPVGIEHMIW